MRRTTDLPGGLAIRSLKAEDVAEVVEIENKAFTNPWRAETFDSMIDREGVELMVMVDEVDSVIGYAVLWCILDQGELANLALVPARRGSGLGAHLLRHVLGVSRDRDLKKLFLEVRSSNTKAIDLYARFGFKDAGVRLGYYESPREDARVMVLDIK